MVELGCFFGHSSVLLYKYYQNLSVLGKICILVLPKSEATLVTCVHRSVHYWDVQ